MTAKRIVRFKVTGSGSFPFEMLTLSECFPATLVDAEKITLSCPTVASEQRITMATYREPSSTEIREWGAKKWPITGIS